MKSIWTVNGSLKYKFTLKMFAIASVKLDVYDNSKNSLISIANAINAPPVNFNAIKIALGDTESLTVSDNFNNASPVLIILMQNMKETLNSCFFFSQK